MLRVAARRLSSLSSPSSSWKSTHAASAIIFKNPLSSGGEANSSTDGSRSTRRYDLRSIGQYLYMPITDEGQSELPTVEIFSISFHWKEKENMGPFHYHLYGIMVIDEGDCLLLIRKPPRSLFTVTNGYNLPLLRLVRRWPKQLCCAFFVHLIGHELGTCSGKCSMKDILIKKNFTLHDEFKKPPCYGYGKPLVETVVGDDDHHYLKIHYSLSCISYYVELEVRLISEGKHEQQHGKIRIDGQLRVRWLEMDDHFNILKHRDARDYTITLIDTKLSNALSSSSNVSGSIYVEPKEAIPIWRQKVVVPKSNTLVFDANMWTDKKDIFFGERQIHVNNNNKCAVKFEGSNHELQIKVIVPDEYKQVVFGDQA